MRGEWFLPVDGEEYSQTGKWNMVVLLNICVFYVWRRSICGQNYHKLQNNQNYFSQIPTILPRFPKETFLLHWHWLWPCNLFGRQNPSKYDLCHIPVEALNALCGCAQALLFFLPQEWACTQRDGWFRLISKWKGTWSRAEQSSAMATAEPPICNWRGKLIPDLRHGDLGVVCYIAKLLNKYTMQCYSAKCYYGKIVFSCFAYLYFLIFVSLTIT